MPYNTQSVSGYNANPPPDDGSQVASNQLTWAKHKTKLGDPLNTAIAAINTEIIRAQTAGELQYYPAVAGETGVTDYSYPVGNVLRYGATGDGVTDDTTSIQNAINSVYTLGGGIVAVPRGDYAVEDLVPKDGVVVRGEIVGQTTPSTSFPSRFISLGNGSHIFNQTTGTLTNFTVDGISFRGPGSTITGNGIYYALIKKCSIFNCSFDNFADEAIKVVDGNVAIIKDTFAQNCLLDRTRAAKAGVVDIAADDCILDTVEVTASLSGTGNRSDANLYLCGLNLGGNNHFVSNVIGEISDIGFYITGYYSRYVNCRADLNQGHGFQLVGAASNSFANCSGTRNSQHADNTYDQWNIDSNSNNNIFSGCNGDALAADTNQGRYGFSDALNSDANKNIYVNCAARFNDTGAMNITAFAGSAVSLPFGGPPKTFTAADATPSVSMYGQFITGAADTYTDFDDPTPGQIITIHAAHAATLTNGANIKTNTGRNKTFIVGQTYTLRDRNGAWYEDENYSTVTATSAQLNSASNDVNTSNVKTAGYMVFNTDTGIPVWAAGSADSSVWVDATGATAHTPS